MATKNKGINSYPSHVDTPYEVVLGTREYLIKDEDDRIFTDASTGETYVGHKIPKHKVTITDSMKYTKLFNGNSILLSGLTDAALKMFYYICDNLKPGSESICVVREDFLSYFGYNAENKPVYYKALSGLLDGNIIARQVGYQSCFFVNPNIMFNGDRTKYTNSRIHNDNDPKVNSNQFGKRSFSFGKESDQDDNSDS